LWAGYGDGCSCTARAYAPASFSASPSAPPPPPEVPADDACSTIEAVWTPAILHLTNETPSPVELYWHAYDCKERLYTTVAPGQTLDQATYVGNTWRVRRPKAGMLLRSIAMAADANVVITDP